MTSYNAVSGKRITDFIGFFLISTERSGAYQPDFESLVDHGMPVFTKGRYEGMVQALLPGINTHPTFDVEDAVLSGDAVNVILVLLLIAL